MNSEYITEAIMERQSSVSREDLGRREREDFKLLLFVHKTNLIVQADIRTLPILGRRNSPPPSCTSTLSVDRCGGEISLSPLMMIRLHGYSNPSPAIFYINPTKIAEISVCCLLKEFYSGEYYRI